MPLVEKKDMLADIISIAAASKDSKLRKRKQGLIKAVETISSSSISQVSESFRQSEIDSTVEFGKVSSSSKSTFSIADDHDMENQTCVEDEGTALQSKPPNGTFGIHQVSSKLPGHFEKHSKAMKDAFLKYYGVKSMRFSLNMHLVEESLVMGILRTIMLILIHVSLGLYLDKRSVEFFYRITCIIASIFFIIDGVLKFGTLPLLWRFGYLHNHNLWNIIQSSGVVDMIISIICLVSVPPPTRLDSADPISAQYLHWIMAVIRCAYQALITFEREKKADVLLSGISYGIRFMTSTLLVLLVFFVSIGMLAKAFFGSNDPYRFGSIYVSIWTLLEMTTMDSWGVVFYTQFYGCAGYSSIYLFPNAIVNGTLISSLPYSVVRDGGAEQNALNGITTKYGNFYLPICEESMAQPVAACFIFYLFIITVPFILFAMNTAAITIGISERLDALKDADSNEKEGENIVSEESETVFGSPILALNTPNNLEKKGDFVQVHTQSIATLLHKLFNEDHIDMEEGAEETSQCLDDPTIQSANEDADTYAYSYINFLSFIWKPDLVAQIKMHAFSLSCDYQWQRFYHINVVASALIALLGLQNGLFPFQIAIILLSMLAVLSGIYVIAKIVGGYPLGTQPLRSMRIQLELFFWFCIVASLMMKPPNKDPKYKLGNEYRASSLLQTAYFFRVILSLNDDHRFHFIFSAVWISLFPLALTFCLLVAVSFYLACVGTILFHNDDVFNFGYLTKSLASVFQIFTLDDWGGIARFNIIGCNYMKYFMWDSLQDPWKDAPLCYYEHKSKEGFIEGSGWGWVAMLYFFAIIFFAFMILLNLVTGIILTAMEMLRNQQHEEEQILEKVSYMKKGL